MVITNLSVRDSVPSDAKPLLRLMRSLAQFEGYIDDFRVQECDVRTHGFGPDPKFKAFVMPSHEQGDLLGMAVTYIIPWTYDLQPVLILKELFVEEAARGYGVGRALMDRVIVHASDIEASKIQWTVLASNHPAKRFYRTYHAKPDAVWESWQLSHSDFPSGA
ncbi:MAG: GNAT family N-acetyltransferase [Hellea sp.]